MRHIVMYDPDMPGWAVVDTEAAHLVISFHETRRDARKAAEAEESNWPAHAPFAAPAWLAA